MNHIPPAWPGYVALILGGILPLLFAVWAATGSELVFVILGITMIVGLVWLVVLAAIMLLW